MRRHLPSDNPTFIIQASFLIRRSFMLRNSHRRSILAALSGIAPIAVTRRLFPRGSAPPGADVR
jgi:hypothetical protein